MAGTRKSINSIFDFFSSWLGIKLLEDWYSVNTIEDFLKSSVLLVILFEVFYSTHHVSLAIGNMDLNELMQHCWKNTIWYLLTFPVSCIKVYHGCGLYVYSSWWQAVQRISHGVYERSWASPWRTKLPTSMFSNAVLAMLSQQPLPSPGHVRRMEKDRLLKDLFYSQLDLCKRQQSLPHLRYNNSCKMTRTQQTLILAHEDVTTAQRPS